MRILFYYRGCESFAIELFSAMLKQRGHEVGLIYDPAFGDTPYFQVPLADALRRRVERKLLRQAQAFRPDLLAFSAPTYTYPYARGVMRLLKTEIDAPAVIGGVHASVLPQKALDDGFDVACVGEGEGALLDLVDCLETRRAFTEIPNLWVRDQDGRRHENPVRPLFQDLDALPYLDKESFYRKGAILHRLDFTTSRDCPYHCSYCYNTALHKIYKNKAKYFRQFSVDRVMAELTFQQEVLRPKSTYFYDDLFFINDDWLREFCEKYARLVHLPFGCQVHPRMISRDSLKYLRAAGCYILDIGVQTADEELRRRIGRFESREEIAHVCRMAREEGIKVSLQWILGLPGETPETMWQTVQMNRELNPHYTYAALLAPFPGTTIFTECLELGLLDRAGAARLEDGYATFHRFFILKHPYRDMAMNLKSFMPVLVNLPDWFLNGPFRRLLRRKHDWLTRAMSVLTIPFMDWRLAVDRTIELLNAAWRYLRS